MPKAKPFSEGDEEEKTTIESQWEDEASTTVEEGDVAEKIRALGVEPRRAGQTNVTSTGAGTLDEPTVDEQHMSAITPVRDVARLQITQGNDAGQELEIRPGKTYTIGRAIDNDVVLSDIAVSRKHFDLRFEDGAWVIVDRGSGNGTVVNGNLEDNPFMLANGDMIEIGNTVFRFDQPNAAARPQRTIDIDEEELSTVAGKPLRTDLAESALPLAAAPRPMRPKTLPPPTPLRAPTQPPPLSYAASPAVPLPAPTLPPAQLGTRAPLPGVAPAMLGDGLAGTGLPGVGLAGGRMPVNGLPTNGLPTNGMPTNPLANASPMATGSAQRAIYTYPQATEIPPHSVHAQMLLIQTQNRRGDGSTALVSPTPFDMMPPQAPRYMPPQLSKRAKLVLAGIGLAVFAGVLTVAIAKSSGSKKPTVAADKQRAATQPAQAKLGALSGEPTATADGTKREPGASEATPTVGKAPATAGATEPTPTIESAKTPAIDTEPTPTITKTAPTRPEPAKPEPTKVAPKKPERVVTKSEPKPRKTPERREPPERRETRRDPTPAPKRVATIDPDDAKDRAESLYRAKKFGEASSVLAAAAKKADDGDARELRRTADTYTKLGRALSQGTAPATKSTDAFEALRQAQAYDRNLGNAFNDEIQTKLAQVAPKAALSYMAAKKYPSARSAVIAAQQFGASESVKLVSQKLESVAGELYNAGMRDLANNPSAAKEKFRQIKTIVDAKSTWYQKAQKQLQGG